MPAIQKLDDEVSLAYFENDLMIRAEMWRKKIEAMKERERTRTMNGSLYPEIMNSKTII